MALNPKRLISATLTNATATYYTATTPVRTRIDMLSICNFTAAPVTFSIWLAPSGSAAGNGNILVKDRSIAANSSGRVLEAVGQWIDSGGTVQMVCSANASVTVTASGIEQTAI